ncbi:MAG: deoxyribonuclease IV [Candidatus Poribacteria bacterium]|nr:deoxyribonuclease IV [Candidatus Poribacteria bacterium]
MMIGAHVSTAGGIHNAISNGTDLGCDSIQIFLKNPNQWAGKSPSESDIDQFIERWRESPIQEILIHDIHLTNLASPKKDVLENSREQFNVQMQLAARLNIRYIVTHLGAHLDSGETEGLQVLSDSLNLALEQITGGDVEILLETTAGQGTNLGYCFEHLRQIIDMSENPERMGVCFDTCHVFAAGYNLCTDADYDETFERFDQIIGLDRLVAFHLNDAKSAFNSRVDRHDHIGEGNLGIPPFQRLVNDPRFEHTPAIIETPKMKVMHATNLAVLRGLLAG